MHACMRIEQSCFNTVRSVPGKHPRVLKHKLQFWPAWVLTWDQNSIHLYRSCYTGPLKYHGMYMGLAQDTVVHVHACTCIIHNVYRCMNMAENMYTIIIFVPPHPNSPLPVQRWGVRLSCTLTPLLPTTTLIGR